MPIVFDREDQDILDRGIDYTDFTELKGADMPISWIKGLFQGAEDKGPVGVLYERIVTQARATPFYSQLSVSDDLDGRFDMIAIHVFLAMNRMRQDASLEPLSQKLANLVISDMDRSLREMGVGDLGVGRRVQNMGKALYGRLEMYDISTQQSELAQEKLSETVMRNLYRSEETPDQNAIKIAEYILAQIESLSKVEASLIEKGEIVFAPVENLLPERAMNLTDHQNKEDIK